MRLRIDEEIRSIDEVLPSEIEKSENETSVKEINHGFLDKDKRETLMNVKCLECHCIGTVMKMKQKVVLRPNTAKETLFNLDGAFFMPKSNNFKVPIVEKKEGSRPEKKLKLAKMIERENFRKSAPEKHSFWKFQSLQAAVYLAFSCVFFGVMIGTSILLLF